MFLPPIPVLALVTGRNWLLGSGVPPAQSPGVLSARTDRQPGLCLTCSQARPLCASIGVRSVRGAKATGQELGISVGIRNELKEQHLSAWGQSEQLVLGLLWNGEGLCPLQAVGRDQGALEEGQVSQCRVSFVPPDNPNTCIPARIKSALATGFASAEKATCPSNL